MERQAGAGCSLQSVLAIEAKLLKACGVEAVGPLSRFPQKGYAVKRRSFF